MADIAGLKLIVPSSVAGSGVSVSASGKVTFAAATSVSVNGCFSATYENYLVVCRYVVDSSPFGPNMQMRLRASGTDNSTANSYVRQVLEVANTAVNPARATSDITRLTEASTAQRSGFHLYVYGPNIAQPTAARTVTVSGRDGAYISDHAWTHNQSTAYDGFTLSMTSSEAFTGALTIYGLSQ